MGRFTILLSPQRQAVRRLTPLRCMRCTRLVQLVHARVGTITNTGLPWQSLPPDVSYTEITCRSCGTLHSLLFQPEVPTDSTVTFYLYANLINSGDFRYDRYDERFCLINCSHCGKPFLKLRGREAQGVEKHKPENIRCPICRMSYLVYFQ